MRVSCTALAKAAGAGLREAADHDPDDPRRSEDAQGHQHRHQHREQPEDRTGHPVGILPPALAQEPRVHRDEGGREHSLAEEVLEDVGDAERGGEGAGQRRGAQVVGEHTLADQPHQPRGEDPQRHQRGAPARARGGCGGLGHGRLLLTCMRSSPHRAPLSPHGKGSGHRRRGEPPEGARRAAPTGRLRRHHRRGRRDGPGRVPEERCRRGHHRSGHAQARRDGGPEGHQRRGARGAGDHHHRARDGGFGGGGHQARGVRLRHQALRPDRAQQRAREGDPHPRVRAAQRPRRDRPPLAGG